MDEATKKTLKFQFAEITADETLICDEVAWERMENTTPLPIDPKPHLLTIQE